MKILVIDADYTYNKNNEPVIRIYGKKVESGEDVVVHVYGFEPYFYLNDCNVDIIELKKEVEKLLGNMLKRAEIVRKYRPIGYQKEKSMMLKLIFYNPRVVPIVRKILVENIEEVADRFIYEADIMFKHRFCVDERIDGMSIIEFDEYGKELKNYGIGCERLYIVGLNDIRVTNDIEKIDY